MAKVTPNDPCPCGLDAKFKKCCAPYLDGLTCDSAERLLRARHTASVLGDAKFLWESLHPQSPRRLRDTWRKFESEHELLKNLDYKSLKLVDLAHTKKDTVQIVHYVTVSESGLDLSYVEESQFMLFEDKWYYMDGLRRSVSRIGCVPESIKIGELSTFFLYDSGHN